MSKKRDIGYCDLCGKENVAIELRDCRNPDKPLWLCVSCCELAKMIDKIEEEVVEEMRKKYRKAIEEWRETHSKED